MLQKKQSGIPAAFFIGRITYNPQKDLRVVCIPPSFACPKEGARKRHPDCPDPSGSLVLLAVAGTLETHRLQRFRQASVLIRQHLRRTAGQDGNKKNKKE
jgi:hypothetical protein